MLYNAAYNFAYGLRLGSKQRSYAAGVRVITQTGGKHRSRSSSPPPYLFALSKSIMKTREREEVMRYSPPRPRSRTVTKRNGRGVGIITRSSGSAELTTVTWPEHKALQPGDVVITVEHCHNCRSHQSTTRHDDRVRGSEPCLCCKRRFSQVAIGFLRLPPSGPGINWARELPNVAGTYAVTVIVCKAARDPGEVEDTCVRYRLFETNGDRVPSCS